jgi:hypothetical protein
MQYSQKILDFRLKNNPSEFAIPHFWKSCSIGIFLPKSGKSSKNNIHLKWLE